MWRKFIRKMKVVEHEARPYRQKTARSLSGYSALLLFSEQKCIDDPGQPSVPHVRLSRRHDLI
jgi:hypothetical protein